MGMKVTEEYGEGAPTIAVTTGNGRNEFRILRALAEKHDGERKTLWFPLGPFNKPGRGLKALDIVKIYPGKYRLTSFLFLVDREYLQRGIEGIKDFLKGTGVNISFFQQIGDGASLISGGVGLHEISIYAVVLGKMKNLEEEIATLIERKLEEKVRPEKSEIRKVLHKHKTNKEKIIEEASNEDLTLAFPNLTLILERMKEGCH